MHDDVAPVLQDPRALFVALGGRRLVSTSLHLDSNFVSQSVHLASVGARRNDEEVHNRRDACQIENHGIFTAVFLAKFCNMAGIFQAALQPGLGGGIGDGSRNGDAPEGILKTRLDLRRGSTLILTTDNSVHQWTHSLCTRFTPVSSRP